MFMTSVIWLVPVQVASSFNLGRGGVRYAIRRNATMSDQTAELEGD